jgi:diguanylate cyclase (GGDEF)-like protein
LLASAAAGLPGAEHLPPDWIAVPLELPGQPAGIVALVVARSTGRFDEDQLNVAETLFEQCLIAYRNATLFSQVDYLASTDALTGLNTRRSFFGQAEAVVAMARARNEPLAAIMFDVDHFKKVNDTYGHGVGDDVLAELGERLREALRGRDVVGRYGGEEFAAILPGAASAAAEIAERLRRSVAAIAMQTRIGPIPVAISVGLAYLSPADTGLESLLSRADAALYQAKRAGRNQVVAADPVPAP